MVPSQPRALPQSCPSQAQIHLLQRHSYVGPAYSIVWHLSVDRMALAKAWQRFRENLSTCTLVGCGIRSSDRIARTNSCTSLKVALKQRHRDRQTRRGHMVGCTRNDLRALGFKFSHGHCASPSTRARMLGSFLAKGKYLPQQFLFFCIAHALYDNHNIATSMALTDHLALELQIHSDFNARVRKWLLRKRHCRYHDKKSDATWTMEAHLRQLASPQSRLLYALLVVCACNSRERYDDWYEIASNTAVVGKCDLIQLRDKIIACLKNMGWLALPIKYAISAATAYECGLETGSGNVIRQHQKVAELTIAKFLYLQGLGSLNQHKVEEAVRSRNVLGPLQAIVLMRLLEIPHTESWTAKSAPCAPVGFSPATLGHLCRDMIVANPGVAAIARAAVPQQEQTWLWTDRHMQHAACEFRKCMHNVGPSYLC